MHPNSELQRNFPTTEAMTPGITVEAFGFKLKISRFAVCTMKARTIRQILSLADNPMPDAC